MSAIALEIASAGIAVSKALSTVPDSIAGEISENSLSCIQHQYTWVTNLSLPSFELNRTVLGLFLSPDSKITASSRFGLNGTIQINSLFSNPVQAKAEPEAIRATLEIASVCQSRSGGGKNKFVVTGIDNLLPSPNDLPSNSPIWQDNSLSGLAANNSSGELKFIAQEATPIIEAQALIKKSDGTVVLTAKSDQVIADAALFAQGKRILFTKKN